MKSLRTSVTILLITAGMLVIALELLYRFQWVDLYRKELTSFNPPQILEPSSNSTVLALGDSFTAGAQSYVETLRRRFSALRIVNGGISGTGVKEALLTAPRRFSDFKPRILIYQIYVGNDLIDMGYHPDWKRFSIARNLWWTVSRWLPSLPYVRRRIDEYRLSKKIAKAPQPSDATGVDTSETFSVDKYNERVKLYYALDPTVLDDSIRLRGIRYFDFKDYILNVKRLVALCTPPACKPYVLVVPHKAQVTAQYFEQEKLLGARLPDPTIYEDEEYPFIRDLRLALVQAGIPLLNPIRALREEARRTVVYFANDDHLNPHGQEVLGEWLVQQLSVSASSR